MYIAGPITGIPDKNITAFTAATNLLLENGHIPICPLTLNELDPVEDNWLSQMKRDLKYLVDCDAVFLLPGWETSKGARLEVQVAKSLDIKVYRATDIRLLEEYITIDCEITPLIPSYFW